jgi:hypothetical protein
MLPSIDPLETIFSWGAKTRLLLAMSPRQVSLRIFGSLRAGSSFAVPSLANLVTGARFPLGTAAKLLNEHTLFGSYMALMSERRTRAIETEFAAGRVSRGFITFYSQSALYGCRNSLRFCEHCAQRDLRTLGYPRWLVRQQLPAAWICTEHESALVELEWPQRPWVLPLDHESRCSSIDPPPVSRHALKIAAAVASTLVGKCSISSQGLRSAALARLVELKVISNPARLNEEVMHAAFLRSSIAAFLATRRLAVGSPLHDRTWAISLIRGRTASHPAKWAILWAWLWESESIETAGDAFCRAMNGEYVAQRCEQLELWSDADGAGQELVLQRVQTRMSSATTLKSLAKSLGVSGQILATWMRSNAVLRDQWAKQQFQMRRDRAITALEDSLKTTAPLSRTDFIDRNVGAVLWLKKHDKAQLQGILDRVPILRSKQSRLSSFF